MTTMTKTFTIEHHHEIASTADSLWRIFADVPGWKRWNAGIEHIELRGPFAVGSELLMKPPGQDPFVSRLIEVRAGEAFTDETRVGELVVVVAHRLAPLEGARTRVTYSLTATGPGADEIGPAIAADFPDVLAALALAAARVRSAT